MKKMLCLYLIFTVCFNVLNAQENQKQLPVEYRQQIKSELLEAKNILLKEEGQLWGHQIWNDSILVVDFDNTIYSLVELPGSKTDDQILYYKTLAPNTLSFTNTTQKLDGHEYATVMTNYLNDESATIIHELFHLLHFKFRKLNGDPINYLDETEARILLRSEYQALRNTLTAIQQNKGTEEVIKSLQDAILFRKLRQDQYNNYLDKELEIETLEGLANYTGLRLSTQNDKYDKAIKEISKREEAQTYTRPFPYATGPAYGLIFDYLNIPWRNGLDKVYNFADIYEKKILKNKLVINGKLIQKAKKRNNYKDIYKQETKAKEEQEKLIDYYTNMLVDKPTLDVAIIDNNYISSYDMNSTLVLKDKGTVFSSIKGIDKSGGKNFGSFSTIEGKEGLGEAGILGFSVNGVYHLVFPKPINITNTQIIGKHYIIELNPNWKITEKDDGNLEIVKY